MPNRQDLGRKEKQEKQEKPEKKKKKKKNLQPEGIPEALKKVMSEFYQQPIENEIESLGIGKDIIELKHEQDLGILPKKKKKKSKKPQDVYDDLVKDFNARTGQVLDSSGQLAETGKKKKKFPIDKNSRKVNFNLKLNSTKFFDTKNIVSQSAGENLKTPSKGILKIKAQEQAKPVKKQRTK